MLAWIIACGEAVGGEYNVRERRWAKRPPPPTVIALMGTLKSGGS